MEDATPGPKRCSVCGDPIRPDNSIGICSNGAKPDCRKARQRAYRHRSPRKQPYEPRPKLTNCGACGKPLNSSNRSGLCDGKTSPECKRERARRAPRKPRPKPAARLCEVCGARLNRSNTMGICGDPYKPACRRERKRRQRDGMIAGRTKPAITAGDVFGKWTALETSPIETRLVSCRCECGTGERRVLGRNLILGLSRDCGCTYMLEAAQRRWPDAYITAGEVFGRLTAMEDVRRGTHKARFLCECGTEVIVQASAVKTGRTRSCGCLRRESITTHGLADHPLYSTWKGIVYRCTNPKADSYADYGGRGVTICERWLDVAAFIEDIEREIGLRPEGKSPSGAPLYTVDRWPDNDGNYEPGNVRWATQSEQILNQRKVSTLTGQRDALAIALDECAAERDALAAEVERLTRLLARRSRELRSPVQEGLF